MNKVKPKFPYYVYLHQVIDYGDGHRAEDFQLAGTTVAKSPAQAANNVRYRLGFPAKCTTVDYYGDGCRTVTFHAYLGRQQERHYDSEAQA